MSQLRNKMKMYMELKGYSSITTKYYLSHISNFAKFYNKSPHLLGEKEINGYLHYCITEKHLTEVSVNTIYSALKLLYTKVLMQSWNIDKTPRMKEPRRLPIVLSPQEVTGSQILKMKDETFDTFDNLDLNIYPDKINKVTIKGTVNSSTTVITGATDKELTAGDKLFMNSVLNEVLSCTGNYTVNTVTDATVVASAYDTSGNSGRKLVKLSNSWFVACVYHATPNGSMQGYSTDNFLYVSKDSGKTWNQLCYITGIMGKNAVISSHDTNVYMIGVIDTGIVRCQVINALTQTNIDTRDQPYVDISADDTIAQQPSLIINPQGTEIHACWTSKKATYPNSFNIRYCKGIINSDGSVTWGSIVQMTSLNASGYNMENPSILIKSNGKAVIIANKNAGSNAGNVIITFIEDLTTMDSPMTRTAWGNKYIYDGTTYVQSSPCAIFVP